MLPSSNHFFASFLLPRFLLLFAQPLFRKQPLCHICSVGGRAGAQQLSNYLLPASPPLVWPAIFGWLAAAATHCLSRLHCGAALPVPPLFILYRTKTCHTESTTYHAPRNTHHTHTHTHHTPIQHTPYITLHTSHTSSKHRRSLPINLPPSYSAPNYQTTCSTCLLCSDLVTLLTQYSTLVLGLFLPWLRGTAASSPTPFIPVPCPFIPSTHFFVTGPNLVISFF